MSTENKNLSNTNPPELQVKAHFSAGSKKDIILTSNTISTSPDFDQNTSEAKAVREALRGTLQDLKEKGYLQSDKATHLAHQELSKLIGTLFPTETSTSVIHLIEVTDKRNVMVTFPNGKSIHFLEGPQLEIIRAMAKKPLSRTEFSDILPQIRKDMSANVSTYLNQMKKRFADADYTIEDYKIDKTTIYRIREINTEKKDEKSQTSVETSGTLFTFPDEKTLEVTSEDVSQTLAQFIHESGMIPNFELGKRLFGQMSNETSQMARRHVAKTNRVISEIAWRIMNTEPGTKDQLWQLQKVELAKEIEETIGSIIMQVSEPIPEEVSAKNEEIPMKEQVIYKPVAREPKPEKETKIPDIERRIPELRSDILGEIKRHQVQHLQIYSHKQAQGAWGISRHEMFNLLEKYGKPDNYNAHHPLFTGEEGVRFALLKKHGRSMSPRHVAELKEIVKEIFAVEEEKYLEEHLENISNTRPFPSK